MNFLFSTWLQSLQIFSPSKFKSLTMAVLRCFYRALKTVLRYFGYMLIFDALLFWLFGDILFKTFALVASTPIPKISLLTALVILLININWFIFSSAMLLFVRKKSIAESFTYFRRTFPAYLQLLFFWLFVILFILLGITRLSHIPWIFTAVYVTIAYLIVFYWLDCSMSFKDIFISLEKAVNFLFYNLPIFIFLLALLWVFDFGVKALFFGIAQAFSMDAVIFSEKIEPLVKMCPTQVSLFLRFLGLRYLVFFLKNLWACFVFVVYDQKKNINYTNSFFDCLSEQQ